MSGKQQIGKFRFCVGLLLIVLIATVAFIGLTSGGVSYIGAIIFCLFVFGLPSLISILGVRYFPYLITFNVVISVSLNISGLFFSYRPSAIAQIIMMFLMLYWLVFIFVNIFSYFKNKNNQGRFALLPLVISILTIPSCMGSNYLGNELQSRFFDCNFVYYEEYAHALEKQLDTEPEIFVSKKDVPEKYQKLAHVVLAHKEKRGAAVVVFMYGSGLPVKHSVYAYIADDVISKEFRERWHPVQKIRDHWYRAGD